MKKKYTTIEDIATATGKSITTVSRVLNNRDKDGISISQKTKELILSTAKEMNYVPNFAARTLSQKNSMAIGLIVPDIAQSYFSELCYHVSREAELNNYSLILSHSFEDANAERKSLEMLISRRVDGIILAPCMGEDNVKYLENIQLQHVPIVLVDRYFLKSNKFISVTSNDSQGEYILVRHIIKKGAKRIAFIMGNKNTSVSVERLEGYKKALADSNIQFDETLVIESSYFQNDGYLATKELIKRKDFKSIDAIIAVNDPVCLGIIDALEESGVRIPEDIIVAGYGNSIYSKYFKIPLSTIDQVVVDIARTSCRTLINLINDKKIKEKNIKIDCKLVSRL